MEKCKYCGKEIKTVDNKRVPKGYCSYACYEHWTKFNKTPNCECVVCHRPMYMKPYRLNRAKNGITCSKECANKLKAQYMKGKGNHQYGLTGDKNSSFAGKEIISEFGYILVYCPGHPFPHDSSNKTTRVFKHRLVIEANADKFDPKFFVIINNKKYLKPEYIVHHINENKQDNRLENLQILTISEHTTIHNYRKGSKIGVDKSGKYGESCNANPMLTSEIAKGSEAV